jgi:hypothetical protein
LPPPAERATSHERSNSAEEKIGRCPHQATLRVLGVVASSGLGSLVCVEKRAKLVLQGRSRLEGAAWSLGGASLCAASHTGTGSGSGSG